jgi:hypothetical protein
MPWCRWIACAALVLAAAGPSFSFEAEGRAKIAADALRLAPPALGRQLARHRADLEKGARETVPATPSEAARRLADDAEAAIAMVNGHKSFRKIARTMGRIAGTMGVLNDPLWGSPGAAPGGDGDKFAAYFREKMNRFPLVFNGYDGFDLAAGDYTGFTGEIRSRYDRDRERLHLAYHPADGGPVRAGDFDDRSVPFAIASLCYSHAVTDTAHVWIRIWKRVNGDLAGTPYLTAAAQRNRP